MKSIVLLLFLALITYSCSLQNSLTDKSGNAELVVQISDNNSSNHYDSFVKKELLVINHNDTLIEQSYSFLVPTGYKSYTSSLNSLPTVHSFSYPKSEYVILLLDTENNLSGDMTYLDTDTFKSELRAIGIEDLINLCLPSSNLKQDRTHSILKMDSLIYLVINNQKGLNNSITYEYKKLIKD